MDDFFIHKPIHGLTDTTYDLIKKYIDFADSRLALTNKDYDLIEQYDLYLGTL